MDAGDVKLKSKIIKARNAIKRKFEELKRGEADTRRFTEEIYKPIVEPIKELVKKSKYNEEFPVKDEVKHENGSLSKQYIDLAIGDTEGAFDHTYGIYHGDQGWKMGNKEVTFEGNSFIINDDTFKGSPGLFELMFKKNPESYTNEDLQTYKTILEITNAHRRDYDPTNQIKGTRNVKYIKIIKPLFKKRKGLGMFKNVTNKYKEYVYWDTPSELVQRLMLLHASKRAGNTGHENEIINIIEELREYKIIA